MSPAPAQSIASREGKVLELMAKGRPVRRFAERLVITLRAVRSASKHLQQPRLPATSDDHRRAFAVLAFLRSELGLKQSRRIGAQTGARHQNPTTRTQLVVLTDSTQHARNEAAQDPERRHAQKWHDGR